MTDPSVWASQAEEARAAYRTRARKEVRARVAMDHQEILQAIDDSIAAGALKTAAQILAGFSQPLEEERHEVRVKAGLERLLQSDLDDPEARFALHELRYLHAFFDGDIETALAQCETMFAIAGKPGTEEAGRSLRARALVSICRLDLRQEDASALETHADELATIAAELGDPFYAGFAPHMIANLREMQGRPAEAQACYESSSALFEKAGAEQMLVVERFNMAACALDAGDLEGAERGFRQTAAIARTLENDHLDPELLSCLAGLRSKQGNPEAGARLLGAAQSALKAAGRVFYPAEEKAAAELERSLQQTLAEDFPVLIEAGRQLSVPEALLIAGIEVS